MDTQAPTATRTGELASPRNARVGVVKATFSETVTAVGLADFSLTRNGVNVSLAGLSVVAINGAYYVNAQHGQSGEALGG